MADIRAMNHNADEWEACLVDMYKAECASFFSFPLDASGTRNVPNPLNKVQNLSL